MSGAVEAGPERAFARARALMPPEIVERIPPGRAVGGYLDLLTDGCAPESTGPTQDLMTTRLVPQIYERYWRPALGRVAKGITGPGMAEEVRIARLMMALSPGDAVLDVACGPGNFAREFARGVGAEGLVVGIDTSPTMLERAAAELEASGLGNLALLRGDVARLPFRDGSFDAVCCFAALHLFAEPFEAIGEMTRVMAPGGRLALMTSVRRELTLPALKPLFQRASGIRIFESEEIVAALQALGYVDIHQRLAGMVQFVGATLGPARG